MKHIKLIRFMSQEEAKAHAEAFENRFNDSYVMPVHRTRWTVDSFGSGFCFFILRDNMPEEDMDIVEHYRYWNKYALEIEMDIDDIYYSMYAGLATYKDNTVVMSEMHFPMIPYWKIKPENFRITKTY